jgi:hypothetical protein
MDCRGANSRLRGYVEPADAGCFAFDVDAAPSRSLTTIASPGSLPAKTSSPGAAVNDLWYKPHFGLRAELLQGEGWPKRAKIFSSS